ncbi:MAG: alkaline phosphatase PhoX, partial [Pseudomonadota bacterium]
SAGAGRDAEVPPEASSGDDVTTVVVVDVSSSTGTVPSEGNYSNVEDFEGMGNNQMLVGDPATGEIHRFLVGPNECEVTGITWSPDRRTVFVGIQHPGEDGNSHFPEGGESAPRSAIIAVTRDDGGIIG